MFGISEKEYERQKHSLELKKIESKGLIFQTILTTASDDLVLINSHVLRKSFIQKIRKGIRHEKEQGTWISYFRFELKGYLDYLTEDIFIPESEISFEDISKKLGLNND